MVQVIKSSAIKAADHIHDIAEDNSLVEGTLCRKVACGFHLRPLARVCLVREDVVKAVLTCVYTTEDKDLTLVRDCRVTITRLWTHTLQTADFEPQVRC